MSDFGSAIVAMKLRVPISVEMDIDIWDKIAYLESEVSTTIERGVGSVVKG